MARTKYFYNSETCSYERVRLRKRDVFMNAMGLFTAAFIFAVVIMVIFNNYFDTPAESALKKENGELRSHYATMASTYEEIKAMKDVLEKRDHGIHTQLYDGEPMDGKLISEGLIPSYSEELTQEGFANQEAVDDFNGRLSQLMAQAKTDNYGLSDYMDMANEKFGALANIPTIQPVDNSDLNALVTGFGNKINPYHHGIVEHEGIDFSVPRGTPVMATATGKVSLVKTSDANTGFGNRVVIDHGNGFITNYYHLDDIYVKRGQSIEKGSPLGTAGISGGTIAPGLHYEILRNGKHINPINFFIEGVSETEYVKLLELSLRSNQSLD